MVQVTRKEQTPAPQTRCQFVMPQNPSSRNTTTQQSTQPTQRRQRIGRPPKTKSYEKLLEFNKPEEKITFKSTGWICFNPNNKKRRHQKAVTPSTVQSNGNHLVQTTYQTTPMVNKKMRTSITWKDLFE